MRVLCVAVAYEATYLLSQPRAAELLARARDVADPAHAQYGNFLTFDEVVALQQPDPAVLARLSAHLAQVGADFHTTVAQDKVVASLPAGAMALPASEPSELWAGLDAVLTPGHAGQGLGEPWAPSRPASSRPRAGAPDLRDPADPTDPQACLAQQVTPECLRAAYGLGETSSTHPDNAQCVVVNQGFKPQDLAQFLQEHHRPAQSVAKLVGKLDGEAGDEASLDVEYIIATGAGTPTWWIYIDGQAANPFASWLTYMSNTTTIPWVQSLSVGAPEGEVGEKLASRMNAELAALGARGATILFASGDSGYTAEQKFGASSPFVTAVGGVWNGDLGDEKLGVDTMSTGGFSSLQANAAPDYQKAAVAHYLTTTGKRPAALDASKRCVPDVTAYDSGFYIVQDGAEQPIGGTSAATPVVAGMMSLINDALLHAGHSPLGFLNPFLYAHEDAFLDVVRGDNGGFEAVPGYDPASGLGTFSPTTFAELKAAALKAKADAKARRAIQLV